MNTYLLAVAYIIKIPYLMATSLSTRPLNKKAQMFFCFVFYYPMRPSFRFIGISKWILQSTLLVLSDCREFPPEQHCKLGLNDFLKSTIIIKQNVT